MKLWIVCGACRHVGKTYLAQRLAAALPGSWCAKLGRHPASDDKPTNYFTDIDLLERQLNELRSSKTAHAIVESNRLAHLGPADIRIYIGPRVEEPHEVREDADQLRRLADITIETDAITPPDWQSLIARQTDRTEEIARIVEDQQAYLRRAKES